MVAGQGFLEPAGDQLEVRYLCQLHGLGGDFFGGPAVVVVGGRFLVAPAIRSRFFRPSLAPAAVPRSCRRGSPSAWPRGRRQCRRSSRPSKRRIPSRNLQRPDSLRQVEVGTEAVARNHGVGLKPLVDRVARHRHAGKRAWAASWRTDRRLMNQAGTQDNSSIKTALRITNSADLPTRISEAPCSPECRLLTPPPAAAVMLGRRLSVVTPHWKSLLIFNDYTFLPRLTPRDLQSKTQLFSTLVSGTRYDNTVDSGMASVRG